MVIDPVIQLSVRLIVVAVFGLAVLHKWRDPRVFRALLDDYRLVPESLTGFAAAGLILAETLVVVGVALGVPIAYWSAVALLALYTVAISVNLIRGRRDIDCGCAGPAARQNLSGWLVLRNGGLIALASVLLWPVGSRTLLWLDGVSVLATAAGFLVIYHTANQLAATHQQLLNRVQ